MIVSPSLFLSLVVVDGSCGIFAGYAHGGAEALSSDGRIVLEGAVHLRRCFVAGHTDGGASDLAALGIAADSESVSAAVFGRTVLTGVLRAYDVSRVARESFDHFNVGGDEFDVGDDESSD